MVEVDTHEAVVVSSGPLTPAEAAEAMRIYQEHSHALIDPAVDMQTIRTRQGPRAFPKRSAFQKLANAYRVSTQILRRDLTHDDEGQLVRCDAIVRATHPDGRYAEGDGACARSEERFARGGEKIDHDLPATAVTRATNRAISNLVAFGAVSAEEVVTDEAPSSAIEPEPTMLPRWAAPASDGVVRQVAQALVDLFKAADVPEPAKHASAIGTAVMANAEDTFPVCVARVIWDIAYHVTAPEEVASAAASRASAAPDAPAEAGVQDPVTGNETTAGGTSA